MNYGPNHVGVNTEGGNFVDITMKKISMKWTLPSDAMVLKEHLCSKEMQRPLKIIIIYGNIKNSNFS